MAIKSKIELTIELNQNITDALNRQNTAARVRQILQDIIDSGANIIDGFTGGTSGNLWAVHLGNNSIIENNNTGNIATGDYSFAAGFQNSATTLNSTVLGGTGNTVSSFGIRSAIVGGERNVVSNIKSFIGGGQTNTASGVYSSVIGGLSNTASGSFSFAAGRQNIASGARSAVLGGLLNVASGTYSSSVGGQHNTASGLASASIGGTGNTASGINTVVIGGGSISATADDSVYMSNARLAEKAGNRIYSAGTPLENIFIGGSGTANTLPVWNSSGLLGDSILTQTASGLTVNGSVQIYGNVDILGTAVTFNTTTVQAQDNNIALNLSGSHVSALYGGITVLSGKTDNSPSTWNIDANGNWSANTDIYTSNLTANGNIISGSTDLYSIFQQLGTVVPTTVQPGSNITTGGTPTSPIISTVASPSFNGILASGATQLNTVTVVSLTGGTISGNTFYSGTTPLSVIINSFSGSSSNLFSGSTGANSIIANNGSGNLASGAFTFAGGFRNTASGITSVIVGGSGSTANGVRAFIGAGSNNQASGLESIVVGGTGNIANGQHSVVIGGRNQQASASYSVVCGGNGSGKATGAASFVGAGYLSLANGGRSAVVGGSRNTASLGGDFVGAGYSNTANGGQASVLGGYSNRATGAKSSVLAGTRNSATTTYSVVVNGSGNTASGIFASVLNGEGNRATGRASAIVGGTGNTVTGINSVVVGGWSISGISNNTVYVPALTIQYGHLTSKQVTAPTISATTQNGVTSAAIVAGSTDVKGAITTNGTQNQSAYTKLSVTFNSSFITAPVVVLMLTTDASTTLQEFVVPSTTGFDFYFLATGSPNADLTFNYIVIE